MNTQMMLPVVLRMQQGNIETGPPDYLLIIYLVLLGLLCFFLLIAGRLSEYYYYKKTYSEYFGSSDAVQTISITQESNRKPEMREAKLRRIKNHRQLRSGRAYKYGLSVELERQDGDCREN